MHILDKQPLSGSSEMSHTVVGHDGESFVLEVHCVFVPPVRLSEHDTYEEALEAAAAKRHKQKEFMDMLAPVLPLLRQMYQPMGVEGALEHFERRRKELGFDKEVKTNE